MQVSFLGIPSSLEVFSGDLRATLYLRYYRNILCPALLRSSLALYKFFLGLHCGVLIPLPGWRSRVPIDLTNMPFTLDFCEFIGCC